MRCVRQMGARTAMEHDDERVLVSLRPARDVGTYCLGLVLPPRHHRCGRAGLSEHVDVLALAPLDRLRRGCHSATSIRADNFTARKSPPSVAGRETVRLTAEP
jgi:hypothetical protein